MRMSSAVTAGRVDTGRPVVLLDIDGVLNAYPDEGNEVGYRWNGYRIFVDPETVEVLEWLFTRADVVWCTAWRDQANGDPLAFLREKGITDAEALPFLTDGKMMQFNTAWKLDQVERFMQVEGAGLSREVFWIEDFGWNPAARHTQLRYTDVVATGVHPIDTVKPSGIAKLMWSDVCAPMKEALG
jgi:hypothetical protein